MAAAVPARRMRELIREGAERTLQAPGPWFQAIDDATLSASGTAQIAADPGLSAAIRQANYDGVITWATANLRAPGEPVAANTSQIQLEVARDLVRRGQDKAALDGYRTGQAAAWQRWMNICFTLTRDPDELEELLAITAVSIESFVSATIAAVADRMDGERDALTRGSEAERRDLVSLILQGAPVSQARAEQLIRYRFDRPHTAAVVWTPFDEGDLGRLERTAEALMHAYGASQRLTIVAAATTLWVWLPVAGAPDRDRIGSVLRNVPQVRVAVGNGSNGVEGFRRSHHDAVEAQRVMASFGNRERRFVSFSDVQLASLVTQDLNRAERYVTQVLGHLADAPVELRETVSTYLAEMGNATASAARLITHRNTVLRRIARAEQLLPHGLDHGPLQIGVALEILRWHSLPTRVDP